MASLHFRKLAKVDVGVVIIIKEIGDLDFACVDDIEREVYIEDQARKKTLVHRSSLSSTRRGRASHPYPRRHQSSHIAGLSIHAKHYPADDGSYDEGFDDEGSDDKGSDAKETDDEGSEDDYDL